MMWLKIVKVRIIDHGISNSMLLFMKCCRVRFVSCKMVEDFRSIDSELKHTILSIGNIFGH